ncbi:MAG: ABC transporter substrate-binding protein [Armatimonadota bacterium]|nr:ABC transporter substrate-binding protein [Armatimonadota bacterium]MDR7471523.1 ABC transporter substrate-binding protein [Armatimonadota bacterium]MDR7516427.1 ABC transporter substrate-binding protein [Armatimonadota bacterium]MDR7581998.1 ABC transporter substrate-binding protein [Armatimonadota bacterium]
MRTIAGVVMVAALVVGLVASSGAQALTPVSFRLNFVAVGLHAPFYLGLDRGFYRDVGIDLRIGEGTGSATTVRLVGNRSDVFGFADAGTTIIGIAQGIPVKIIAPVYQMNAFAIIAAPDAGIAKPKDLEGKRVGVTPGDALSALWPALVGANNIDESKVRLVAMDPAAKVPAILNKQVEAILGGADDQAVTLRQRGMPVVVLRFADYGVSTIGLSIIAHQDTLAAQPDLVRRFLRATVRSWDVARRNPDVAVAVQKRYIPALNEAIARDQLAVAISSLFSKSSNELMKATDKDWLDTVVLLARYMGLTGRYGPKYYYDQSFLPDSLPGR